MCTCDVDDSPNHCAACTRALAPDTALRAQVEELTRERERLNACAENTLDEIAERTVDNIACATQHEPDEYTREAHLLNIHAALQQACDLARAERDKEWQQAVGMHVSTPDSVAHIFADAERRMDAAVAEERKALREMVEARRREDDKKRPLSVLRTTDQAVCDDILAALDARESAR